MNSKFVAVALLLLPTLALALAVDLKFRMQEIDATLKVGYGVVIADVNDDGKPDIFAAGRQTGNVRIYWH